MQFLHSSSDVLSVHRQSHEDIKATTKAVFELFNSYSMNLKNTDVSLCATKLDCYVNQIFKKNFSFPVIL